LRNGEQFKSDLSAAWQADLSLQGVLMKIGLVSRSAIDVVTHLLPFAPKFHLNGSNVSDKEIVELKQLAQPLLAPFDLEYDFVSTDSIEL
jgi:hypothetical protein